MGPTWEGAWPVGTQDHAGRFSYSSPPPRSLPSHSPAPPTAFSCLGALGPVLATLQHLLMAWLTHSTHRLAHTPWCPHGAMLVHCSLLSVFLVPLFSGSQTGSRCCNSRPCRSVERGRRLCRPVGLRMGGGGAADPLSGPGAWGTRAGASCVQGATLC